MKSLLKVFVFVGIVLMVGSVFGEDVLLPEPLEKEIKQPTGAVISEKRMSIEQSELMAKTLFDNIWEELCDKFGERNLRFPKQVVFLNGAPGAGKGTNTANVMRALEIPSPPIEVSSLLTTPECESLKKQGLLVGDDIVISQVMYELLKRENRRGIIIDGFPRTIVQAFFLKNLIYKLHDLNDKKPTGFKLVKFSVSRATSIERQISRGAKAIEENKPVRATDMSFEAAERRYQIYEDSINICMEILRDDVPIYDINAEGTFEEVRRRTFDILSDK
ncbi:MAG: nucleoside monophosphate kinase [Puniceicoccales bacterium]|nr:nucleoside monophosphate kinase [Puniceicoccales bacterium]